MRAIILAAGLGSRMLPLTKDKPKCLIKFSGKTLLERLQKTFASCNINNITLVVGHQKEKITSKNFDLITNNEYKNSGIMHSLYCAREKFVDSIIVSYGDIIFEKSVLTKLLESKDDIATVIDKEWERYWRLRTDDPLSDAESLTVDKDNFIPRFSVNFELCYFDYFITLEIFT